MAEQELYSVVDISKKILANIESIKEIKSDIDYYLKQLNKIESSNSVSKSI